MTSLDLALIGNGTIGALIDAQGTIVWCCLPRFDGDPTFCSLLKDRYKDVGSFAIELLGQTRTEQQYVPDTAILQTRLYGENGDAVEIADFCPRFDNGGTLFCPPVVMRRISPLAGTPKIRVRLTPYASCGCTLLGPMVDDNTIHYGDGAGNTPFSLVTNLPVAAIVDGLPYPVDTSGTLMFGSAWPSVENLTDDYTSWYERTESYWHSWVESLDPPEEWRDAVVRAAITLQLNVFEETGAIIASVTTSIPEAPDSGRNWDYRYCWPRDAFFVANSLERVGDVRTTERLLAFILGIADAARGSELGPLYTIDGEFIPEERAAPEEGLDGYRGMGPVRIGNGAREQIQHDVYGEAVLTAEPLYTTSRAKSVGDESLLRRLEVLGEHAVRLHDVPDAGLWELRGSARVHTFSSVMCWAACDRLSIYADQLGLADRSEYWRAHAARIRENILRRSWNSTLNALTAALDGDT
jgi:GH15 family glucan-1,4-alpha-glucosidase